MKVKNNMSIRLNRPCQIKKAKQYGRVAFALLLHSDIGEKLWLEHWQ